MKVATLRRRRVSGFHLGSRGHRGQALILSLFMIAGLTGEFAEASNLDDDRDRRPAQSQASVPTAVALAFDSPAPTNPTDPCRTGTDVKSNEIGDHDGIIVCTFDRGGKPVPTDTSTAHLDWDLTDIQGTTSTVVGFNPTSPPIETSGPGASANLGIDAQQTGEVLVTVYLLDGSGQIIDTKSIEKQVGNPCPEAAPLDSNDNPILPPGATDVEGPEGVDEDLGSVGSLYPELDTSTADFYPQLPCDPSLDEGTLPAEAVEPPSEEEVEAQEFLEDFTDTKVPNIVSRLNSGRRLRLPNLGTINNKPGPCFIDGPDLNGDGVPDPHEQVPCSSDRFLQSGQPFEGKDIVYMHGLAMGNLTQWIAGNKKAHKKWPSQPAQFLNSTGYFRKYAEAYWVDHIREHLFDPRVPTNLSAGIDWSTGSPAYNRKSNRYLAVSWSSNQTIEYAQHAFLQQIALAIQSKKNVNTSPVYPSSFSRPFGSNGLIVVSHSTGGLIVSSALSRAAAGDFGIPGKRIAKRVQLHVAFNGAMSGSNLATAAMAVALAASPFGTPQIVCDILDALDLPCYGNLTFVAHSILRDLIPQVAQLVWGDEVDSSPVPTLTVAGGHPMGNFVGLTKILLPGLDDGVVNMNSACGNPNRLLFGAVPASGVKVTSLVKAFDRGVPVARAVKNFLSHLDTHGLPDFRYLAGACLPYLSPTGMQMPVSNVYGGTPKDTLNRYGNHFSFIQGSMDHSYEGGSAANNPWPSSKTPADPATTPRAYLHTNFFGPNCEELSAISDGGAYQQFPDGTHLVQPAFQNEMRQVVRGRKISFRLFKKRYTRWIWRRNYFLLGGNDCTRSSSHYVYQYVGRR